jgi:hypothetical protein
MYFPNLLQVDIPSTEAEYLLVPQPVSPQIDGFVLSVQ